MANRLICPKKAGSFYRLLIIWLTVFALILSMAATLITPAKAFEKTTGTVVNVSSGSSLKVRSGAGSSNSQVGSLKAGAIVTVIDEAYDQSGAKWYIIEYEKYETGKGYVHSGYVQLAGEDVVVEPGKTVTGETWEETLALFPTSYREGLESLHETYPNWIFKAMYVEYGWDYTIAEQNTGGRSLVENNFPSSWKSTKEGDYNWETSTWTIYDAGRWVAASEAIIRYHMDPRNFLDATTVFQFLDQSYDGSVQNVEGVQTILKGTFMEGYMPDDYTTNEQGEQVPGLTYAQCIYDASKEYGANPYVIASMLLTEQGRNGSALSDGTYSGYEGYYNFFNYGAYGTTAAETITRGLEYAKSHGWDTRKKAIYGGTKAYTADYINAGQTTLYLMKFNVQGQNAFYHQYMTCIYGPKMEGSTLAGAYDTDMRASALVFTIPVYSGMPATASPKPTGDGSPNMKLKSLGVTGYTITPEFNLDTLEYSAIVASDATSVAVTADAYDSKATIVGTGTITLTGDVTTVNIKVTAENGDVRTYKLTIAKESSETDDNTAVFTDMYPMKGTADATYIIIAPGLTAEIVKENILTRGSVIITQSDKSSKDDSAVMCTGDKVYIYNADGSDYGGALTVAVKGDVTGDGLVTGTDFIKIRNHILKTTTLNELAAMAADVDVSGSVNGSDFIKIRNHILKTAALF